MSLNIADRKSMNYRARLARYPPEWHKLCPWSSVARKRGTTRESE